MNANLFDTTPIPLLYALTVLLFFAADETGYRFGTRHKTQAGNLKESLVGANLGILLGFLAFIVAFFVSMSASRFDARIQLVLKDSNSIGTTNLRADLLPEPYSTQVHDLIREYVDVRVAAGDDYIGMSEAMATSEKLLNQMWAAGAGAAEARPTPITATFISSLNETIDINSERIFAAEFNRMPASAILTAYIVATVSFLLLGFNNSLHEDRNLVAFTLVAIVFSLVIVLIVDLDRPREGLLRISNQPMIDLQAQLHEAAGIE